jgi:hypothetical protein
MRHRFARGTIIGLAALGAGAAPAGALAQAAAPPRAFAGYSQPAIPPSACKTLGATETQCVIPAMTAGRYMIEAAGTSTSQGVGANQVLEIDVGGGQCGVGRDSGAWTSGPRTFRLDCEVSLLADAPVTVRVIYADAQAVKDPKGPTVTFKPLPWTGVLSAQAFAPRQ